MFGLFVYSLKDNYIIDRLDSIMVDMNNNEYVHSQNNELLPVPVWISKISITCIPFGPW